MNRAELAAAFRASWSAFTAERPERWTPENPAYLQCSATALAVRALLGGDIVIAAVERDGRSAGYHAWNRLPDGTELDLTREQFGDGETIGAPRVQEPIRGHLASVLLLARVTRRLESGTES